MPAAAGVHPDVKAAVIAWAGAADLDAAAAILDESRKKLDPGLLPQLRTEVAEISAESFVALLALERDVVPGPKPVEILGVELHPKQAERLSAWLQDQRSTAEALGLEPEAWGRMIDAGMKRYLANERGAAGPVPRDASKRVIEAQRLLGTASAKGFANPRTPVGRRGSGLLDILAARSSSRRNKN